MNFKQFFLTIATTVIMLSSGMQATGVEIRRIDSMFFNAVKNEQWFKARALIFAGTNINAKDNDNKAPIHYAAEHGNKDFISLLIENGADVNAVDNSNSTALHLNAFYGNDINITRLLVGKGANVNAKNDNGWTPLHYTAKQGNKDIISFLIENGADVNAADNSNFTPIKFSRYYTYLKFTKP